MRDKPRQTRFIAVTGKGGSGKTALTSLMVKLLSNGHKVLAIDADCGGGLTYALGIKVEKTIGDIRKTIIENPIAPAEIEDRPIREVIADIATVGKGFSFLAMGRAEGPGCFCHVNELLKYGIDSIAGEYDVVIIDCEAGPEQINRRVVQKVDTLVITVDNSIRSIQVAAVIGDLARGPVASGVDKIALVVNKYNDAKRDTGILKAAMDLGLPLLGCVAEDPCLAEYDSLGKPLIELPDDTSSVLAVREIIRNLDLDG